jgi:hypothetical protein
MTYSFKRRRGVQIFGCIALAALATIFMLQGLLMSAAAGPLVMEWIAIGVAVMLYALLIPIVRETFTPGPMLVIGPEGLLYRPYSPEVIPWSEISEIKLVQAPPRRRRDDGETGAYMGVPISRHGEEQSSLNAGVMFNVRDPSRYRVRGGFSNAMTSLGAGMTGGIAITMVQATTAEILAAIKTHWRGDIPVAAPFNPLAAAVDKR